MQIIRATIPLVLIAALAFRSAPAIAADPTPGPSADAAPAAAEKPTTTKTGLQYVDIKVGTGASPQPGQMAMVNYTMYDGPKVIEKSSAGKPFGFIIGRDQALKGLEEGVTTMKAGGQRKLTVPPELGYGASGHPSVAPNTTLIIEVELVEVH